MASYNLNEILKYRAAKGVGTEDSETRLSDSARIKVLSPMRQVMKRFLRNRLALFGLVTLAAMFVFAFFGPIFSSYGAQEINYKYGAEEADYSYAQFRAEYYSYVLDPTVSYSSSELIRVTADIDAMESNGKREMSFVSNNHVYLLAHEGKGVYKLSQGGTKVATLGSGTAKIGVYSGLSKKMDFEGEALGDDFVLYIAENCDEKKEGTFEFGGVTYTYKPGGAKRSIEIYQELQGFQYVGGALNESFETAAKSAAIGDMFEVDGKKYTSVSPVEGSREFYALDTGIPLMVYSNLSFDPCVTALPLSDDFKAKALLAIYGGRSFEASAIVDTERFQKEFAAKASAADASAETPNVTGEYVKAQFTIAPSTEYDGVYVVRTASGTPYAELNNLVVRRTNESGTDTMDLDLKHAIRSVVMKMDKEHTTRESLEFNLPKQDSEGRYVYENGVLQYEKDKLTITRDYTGGFKITAFQTRLLTDSYAPPSSEHKFGTDANGFDVLARIMHGGRISLLLGFVVVLLECLFGIAAGGVAGFYGGWIDNLVMRVVDVFNCLPRFPVLIIIGALMDAGHINENLRPFILMAAMGFIGWASVARLVRGQILSLREQEFMTAAEATGLPTSRRIFRHLIPNVMPQLLVSATMGLGSAILTESTLSFLGIGVRYPVATWGSMINPVTQDPTLMEQFSYIWLPVGLLICLTIIAFNFVGDGLRDAFDPKAKK